MNKLTEQLRAIRVFNNYELLERFGAVGDVVIAYSPPERRAARPSKTRVWSIFKHPKLKKPVAALYTGGGEMSFYGKRKYSLPEALTWAQTTFGHEYVPSPFRGYIPKHVLLKAKEAVNGTARQAQGATQA